MSQLPDVMPSLLSRRMLLKMFGVGAIGGAMGYSWFSKPQPTVIQQDLLKLPPSLGNEPKRVVVVGGGLAGLACAYELSQRGFIVTLLELSSQLGGKVASWPVQVGNETFMMEHGFHGFFPQYYNLNHLVQELGIGKNFVDLKSYSVVFRNNKYQPEVFRPSNSAFPWNVVDLAIASPNWRRWGIDLTHVAHWQVLRAIAGFHPQKSFQQLDHLSVAEWVEQDFPQGLYDLYFLPFAKASLNAPDQMSAGELMQFFHFYFFGNPEGLAFNGTRQDMGTALVQPIAQAIIRQGGSIITGATVREIHCSQAEIEFLSYQVGSAGSAAPFWVDCNSTDDQTMPPLQDLGTADRAFALIEDRQEAISLTCTHQGCTVQQQADGKFQCPCHGALFDRDGRVLKGPAQRDLSRYKVVGQRENQLQLAAVQAVASPQVTTKETSQADYYVFATDVPGVKHLITLMTGEVDSQLQQQVHKLAIANPFAVCRFWFDRDFEWPHSYFTSVSGYQLTDSITLYHRIQTQYIDWAQRTGGSVVELHAYGYKEKDFPTQQALLTTFEQELYEIVPQLQQATMLHRELVNQKNFSGYPPNSYADRPETSTTIPNLLFAGDWVKLPFPSGLMERAVSSGLWAANEILHREGLQRRVLFSVHPEGVLKI